MSLTRRDFLKLAGLGAGAMALRPFGGALPVRPAHIVPASLWEDFPKAEHLGRLTVTLDYRSEPRVDDYTLLNKKAYEDQVVPILREVISSSPFISFPHNQRWFETPDGYLYAGYVQPVQNRPNEPLQSIPDAKPGFWAEVTVPYVDLNLDNPPARMGWTKDLLAAGLSPRLYYSQIVWIDQIKTGDNGQILYQFNENGGRRPGDTGGNSGDVFLADAKALRPLTPEDVSPINPDVDPETKKIIVNTTYQTLSCMEENREVYFCRCSTGAKFDATGTEVDNWSTSPGDYKTQWKALSIHMSGGTTGAGYDTPAVSWTNFFDSQKGMAIHAAFWHNMFGELVSHGCVNVKPEDAKWIFRWTAPQLSLEDADVRQIPEGTHVLIQERQF
jgi:hypothetical protein